MRSAYSASTSPSSTKRHGCVLCVLGARIAYETSAARSVASSVAAGGGAAAAFQASSGGMNRGARGRATGDVIVAS